MDDFNFLEDSNGPRPPPMHPLLPALPDSLGASLPEPGSLGLQAFPEGSPELTLLLPRTRARQVISRDPKLCAKDPTVLTLLV